MVSQIYNDICALLIGIITKTSFLHFLLSYQYTAFILGFISQHCFTSTTRMSATTDQKVIHLITTICNPATFTTYTTTTYTITTSTTTSTPTPTATSPVWEPLASQGSARTLQVLYIVHFQILYTVHFQVLYLVHRTLPGKVPCTVQQKLFVNPKNFLESDLSSKSSQGEHYFGHHLDLPGSRSFLGLVFLHLMLCIYITCYQIHFNPYF